MKGAETMIARSRTGATLEVHENKIVITRRGFQQFLTKGLKGSKEIPIRNITAIQYKSPSLFVSGYIQFSLAGGIESRGGWQDAGFDENTVEFLHAEEPVFRAAKLKIEQRMDQIASPAVSVRQPAAASSEDPISKLERLAKLRASGVLSEAEFVAAKAGILGLDPTPAPEPDDDSAECPQCAARLPWVTLRQGNNWCPKCGTKFCVE